MVMTVQNLMVYEDYADERKNKFQWYLQRRFCAKVNSDHKNISSIFNKGNEQNYYV